MEEEVRWECVEFLIKIACACDDDVYVGSHAHTAMCAQCDRQYRFTCTPDWKVEEVSGL
jgi:hypothetical protein